MSQHRYTYVYNNPVNNTDLTGMVTCGPGYDCTGFDNYEWFEYNVRVVESVEYEADGYWESGYHADIRYWELHVHWVNKPDDVYSGGKILDRYDYFRERKTTAPPSPPEPTPEEIDQQDNQQKGQHGEVPGSYTVQSGDTMGAIADAYGISLQELLAANPQVSNPDLIHVDQTLNMPGSINPDGRKVWPVSR